MSREEDITLVLSGSEDGKQMVTLFVRRLTEGGGKIVGMNFAGQVIEEEALEEINLPIMPDEVITYFQQENPIKTDFIKNSSKEEILAFVQSKIASKRG